MRCLLVCGAHPDDETFFAGTVAKYASEGVRVCVLCATRGERGNTGDICSIPELPKFREAELRASARVIGVREQDVFFLPYEDQKLHLAPLDEVRNNIVCVVRQIRPQVVVTFDPHGANGHTDHLAISRFVSDSIPAAGDSRCGGENGAPWIVSRLLWQPPWLFSRMPGGTNTAQSFGADFLIDIARFAQAKHSAILAHRTQLPGIERLFLGPGNRNLSFNQEIFRLAWGPRPLRIPASDLFERLTESR